MNDILKEVDVYQQHADICEGIHELWKSKNHDYGNSYDKTRAEYGPIAACLRLEDKLNRLKQLSNVPHSLPSKVTDETTEDTLRDIAGYAILELLYLERNK